MSFYEYEQDEYELVRVGFEISKRVRSVSNPLLSSSLCLSLNTRFESEMMASVG